MPYPIDRSRDIYEKIQRERAEQIKHTYRFAPSDIFNRIFYIDEKWVLFVDFNWTRRTFVVVINNEYAEMEISELPLEVRCLFDSQYEEQVNTPRFG